jgi:ankyrin repeat protein
MSLPLSLDPSFSGSLDKFKESFLCAAAQGGNTEDCESLLEIGANVEWRNADGDTPLLSAVRRGHAETAALLLVHGADLNARGHDGLTPLHVVCRNGDVRTMNVLLNAGASPQVVSDSNQTPVDIARSKGYVDIVKRLTSSVDASGGSTPGASSSLGGSGTLPPVVPQRYDSDMVRL